MGVHVFLQTDPDPLVRFRTLLWVHPPPFRAYVLFEWPLVNYDGVFTTDFLLPNWRVSCFIQSIINSFHCKFSTSFLFCHITTPTILSTLEVRSEFCKRRCTDVSIISRDQLVHVPWCSQLREWLAPKEAQNSKDAFHTFQTMHGYGSE